MGWNHEEIEMKENLENKTYLKLAISIFGKLIS